MAVTPSAYLHNLLLNCGWEAYQNIAQNLSGWRHPDYEHGMKLLDTEKALATQREWHRAAEEARWLKRPRYHWGPEAAAAMGAR